MKKKHIDFLVKKMNFLIGRVEKITPFQVYLFMILASLLVFGMRLTLNRDQWTRIRVEVVGKDWVEANGTYSYKVPFWLSDTLEVGQSQRDSLGREIAKIIEVENYERGSEEAFIYLVIDVKTQFDKETSLRNFKNKPVIVGESLEFIFSETKVPVQVISSNYHKEKLPQKKYLVEGELRNKEAWFVDSIEVGDRMINRSNGQVVAEIIEVNTTPSQTKILTFLTNNELGFSEKQELFDVNLKLLVDVQQIDGRWYFAGHQRVRVGSYIWVHAEDLSLSGILVKKVNDFSIE